MIPIHNANGHGSFGKIYEEKLLIAKCFDAVLPVDEAEKQLLSINGNQKESLLFWHDEIPYWLVAFSFSVLHIFLSQKHFRLNCS